MTINLLRIKPEAIVQQHKYEQVFNAIDEGTEMTMLPCGHFIVTKYGKSILYTSASVGYADVVKDGPKSSKADAK